MTIKVSLGVTEFTRTRGGEQMGIMSPVISLFRGWFGKDGTLELSSQIGTLTTEVFYKELAVQSCINLIANTLAQAEIKTFEKGESVRKNNYYLFNVEPNPNTSATRFWRDVITRLVYENECLVIQNDGHFYVAESFSTQRYAFKDYIFTNIVLDGLLLKRAYAGPEVFYLENHNHEIRKVIEGLYGSYSKLIAASQNHYKRNNARRGKLKIPTSYPKTPEAEGALQKLLDENFKRFFEAEGGAVLPLTNGLEFDELTSNIGVKGGIEGRDVRAFIDDIMDFVGMAFGVPPVLLKGTVADAEKAVDQFLTFCINPLAKLIADEINRKYYTKDKYLKRDYAKFDTTKIRAVNIKDVAGSIDILLRTGSFTIDDCLGVLGMNPIGGELGKQRFMTKNYEPIEDRLKGGE